MVVHHVRSHFFVAWSHLPSHSVWYAAFTVMTDIGHQAVIVFFVISGYLVGGSVQRELEAGRFQVKAYSAHRIARVYAALPAALLVGATLDVLGSRVFDYAAARSLATPQPELSWTVALINLVNCQEIIGPVLGTNSALWSLSYEVWFYVLFGAIAVIVDQRRSYRCRTIGVGLSLAVAWFVGLMGLSYFAVWLVGAALCRMRRPLIPSVRAAAVVLLVIFFSASPMAYRWPLESVEIMVDLVLAVAFGNLILAVGAAAEERPSPVERCAHLNKRLAAFSYSMYLTHVPMLALLAAVTHPSGEPRGGFLVPDPRGVASMFGLVAMSCLYGCGFAWLTERHTPTLRGWLEKRMRARQPSAQSIS